MEMTYQVFIVNPEQAVKMEKILKMLEGDIEVGKHTNTEPYQINEKEIYQTYVVVCTRKILRVINEYVGLRSMN